MSLGTENSSELLLHADVAKNDLSIMQGLKPNEEANSLNDSMVQTFMTFAKECDEKSVLRQQQKLHKQNVTEKNDEEQSHTHLKIHQREDRDKIDNGSYQAPIMPTQSKPATPASADDVLLER